MKNEKWVTDRTMGEFLDTQSPSTESPSTESQELEYLRHFYREADFGPAHGDVVWMINNAYEGVIPEGYGNEEEE